MITQTASESGVPWTSLLTEWPSAAGLLAPFGIGIAILARGNQPISFRRTRQGDPALRQSNLFALTRSRVARLIFYVFVGLGVPLVSFASCFEISDRHTYAHRMYFEATVPAGLALGSDRAQVDAYLKSRGMNVSFDADTKRMRGVSDEFRYGPCLLAVFLTAQFDDTGRLTNVTAEPQGSCL